MEIRTDSFLVYLEKGKNRYIAVRMFTIIASTFMLCLWLCLLNLHKHLQFCEQRLQKFLMLIQLPSTFIDVP
jgi:hypothetical protein